MSTYEFGPYRLNVEQLLLTHEGTPVALGPKVVETQLALVEHSGEVLAKRALVDRIWPEGFVEEANLAQNIHVLRKTFRQHRSVDPIETVPRRGYRFTAPVRPLADVPRVQATPRAEFAFSRRIAAAVASAVFLAASLVLVAGYGSGHRSATHHTGMYG